ncbi:hypothetical protein [Bacillus pseudomycoides]|uniref:hypothetical protein n=1 Tax=Bacillus pseudomycoides TaxID=64104 RepID=UPI0015CF612C|nr:hypothetical protein [Bacillus pseudomycoides]
MKQYVIYRDATVIICFEEEFKKMKTMGWKLYKTAYTEEQANHYAEECCYI